MKKLSKQDLEHILNGSCILGSGGGGPLSIGRQLMEHVLSSPNPVWLADPRKDVDGDDMMAVSAFAGSPDAATQQAFPFDSPTEAFDRLNELQQKETERTFSFVLPIEIGAGNSFIPMTVAVRKSIPLVDASGARQAFPSLTMSTYASKGAVVSPLVLANQEHHVSINAPDVSAAENSMRAIVSTPEFDQGAGIAAWSMCGATMKDVAIHNTLSYAHKLGEKLQQAIEKKTDPGEAIREYLHGWILFRGRIVSVDEQTQGGFDVGRVVLRGDNSEQVWIYNQNENLIAWNTNRSLPLAMGPDLICYLTADGQPFSNADLKLAKDKDVVIVGAKTKPESRAPSIVNAFLTLLRTMGYAGPYVPIEDLQP